MDPTSTIPNAQAAVGEIANQASGVVSELADQAEGWLAQAQTCMRNYPVASVLVAVGVGALVGYFVSNSCHSSQDD